MKSTFAILLFVLVSPFALAADVSESEPWKRPRSMENFKSLLERSPFSLPTAEESAPVADRFFLTGVATINEQPTVFIFDKNTQNRLMLGKIEGAENQAKDRLIDLLQDPDPKNLRATVQIEGQRAEIRFSETAFAPPSAQPMPAQAGVPGQHIPLQPPVPGQQPAVQPGNDSNSQPPRRVIRRRVISGQAPAAQPIPGQ